ncbi:MAG: toxin Cry1Ac domain D-VI-related protein [Clostridium sp.]|uniref:toxin Cry1Ac domain D-VI-related protein n=1 Tax=Clostridium sp. TaxID=1506 RepID=UPI003216F2FD
MSKKSTKVLSGALATSLMMGAMPVFAADTTEPNYDALYAAALTAAQKAETDKTQVAVTAARTAIKPLLDAYKNGQTWLESMVGTLSSMVDAVQQNLFNEFYAILYVNGELKATLTQAEIDQARGYVDGFKTYEGNTEYITSWSSAVDTFQQAKFDVAFAAVEKAKKSGLQADVDAAQVLLDEIATSKVESVKTWAKTVQVQLNTVKAEVTVKAFETAKLTNADEVIAAEKLGAMARQLVEALANEEIKAELSAKLDAQDKVVLARRVAEEAKAITLVKKSTKYNVISRLSAPILGLENVRTELAKEYNDAILAGNYSNTIAEIQINIVNFVNEVADSKVQANVDHDNKVLATQFKIMNDAVTEYKKAPSDAARLSAIAKLNAPAVVLTTKVTDTSITTGLDGLIIAQLKDYTNVNAEAYMKALVVGKTLTTLEQLQEVVDTVNAEVKANAALAVAKTAVNNLYATKVVDGKTVPDYEKIAVGTSQTTIDAAAKLVNELADSSDKTVLVTLIEDAQALLDAQGLDAKVKIATTAVDSLFGTKVVDGKTVPDYEKLAAGTLQATIDAAMKLVNELPATVAATKVELLAKIEVAQVLLDTKIAIAAVDALFTTPDTVLAADATQAKLDAALKLVNALPYEVNDKATLIARLVDAQKLMDVKVVTDATAAVTALFSTPDTAIAVGMKQETIDAATKLVTALKDSDAKTALVARIATAQKLYDAQLLSEATAAVAGLETLGGQTEINAASKLVTALKDSDAKTALVAKIVKAQGVLETKVTGTVDTLFGTTVDSKVDYTKLAVAMDQSKITAQLDAVKALNDSAVKTTLLARVNIAQELFLVANVNAADDKVKTLTALTAINYANFTNVGGAVRPEVAELFFVNHKDTEFKTVVEIKTAMDSMIAKHAQLLAGVNGSKTISEMMVALTEMGIKNVTAEKAEDVLQAMKVDKFPGFKTILEINTIVNP